ncbi:hypothetical protein BDW68DRAFT_176843 [Aspergillus falconensis]
MPSHNYSDRANVSHRMPSSDSKEDRPFQRISLSRYHPNPRYMPTYPLNSTIIRSRCPYRPWLGKSRDYAHLRPQSPREPYQYRNLELEPEAEPERDDDGLDASTELLSSPDGGDPLIVDDGEYVASESEPSRRRHGELGRWKYRRDGLRTFLPLSISMAFGNDDDTDDFADGDLNMDMDDDDDYDSEDGGEYELGGDLPRGSRASSGHNQDGRDELHSQRGMITDLENLFREKKIADRDSAAARTLIEIGGSAPARRGRLRRGCRHHGTDTVDDADDEDEGNGSGQMETDSLSSGLVQGGSSGRIETRSERRYDDYKFATEQRHRRRIENDGYTVAEDELAQSVVYEDTRQNRLNRFSQESTGSGRRCQNQAPMGRIERQPALFPDSDEEVWSDIMPTESEICGAGVDVHDSDALSEARSTPGYSPARARSRVTASGQDVEKRGQLSRRGSQRQSECLRPGQGQLLKRKLACESEREPETKDEDEYENDGQEEEEEQKEEEREEVKENDEDEDEERKDEKREDEESEAEDDEEKRNYRNAQSDTNTEVDDTLVATPTPPSTPSLEYLSAESGDENESEQSTEESHSQLEISESPSPFPVPPKTPGSEPKCNFSYPRPCTAMESGEHPYPRKVISHIFGRNKKVTKQIPPWIWVYYCRRHYQRARYRAGSDGREWARIQCERVLDLFEAMRKWGMVEGFTVHLRSREVERLVGAVRASSAPARSSNSRRGGRRGRHGGKARGGERVQSRAWTPADEDSDENRQPKQETRQERPSVPSPVPDWLASWTQRHEGEVIAIEQAEALIQRILAHINVVQMEEVRFPDIEILPVYKEGWPPTTTRMSADSVRPVRGRAISALVASSSGSGDKAWRGAISARCTDNNLERPSKRSRMSAGDAVGRRRH